MSLQSAGIGLFWRTGFANLPRRAVALGEGRSTPQPSTSQLLPMADTYVPMISSGTAGPLGVLHLPRMWQKVSLESQGKLAAGYPGIGKGYDAMTCAALGLDEQAVKDFIRQNKPTYPEFEAWVKKNGKT